MDSDETEHRDAPSGSNLPAVRGSAAPAAAPRGASLDAEFRVLWAPWRRLSLHWWALGPYLAYCAVLWGLAALIGWVL